MLCADRADVFFAAAATFVLLFCLQYGIANSPSPDFPVAVLTVLAAWSYLAIRDDSKAVAPCVLVLGAATVKLSAVALLVAAGALLFFKLDGKRKLVMAAGSAVVLAPVPIGLCWDVPLPCATETLDVVLKLRDPVRGLAAGFARAK